MIPSGPFETPSASSPAGPLPRAGDVRRAASTLALLANPQRLRILCRLVRHGELSVGQLNEGLPLSPSALSQHLARLRRQRLVVTRKESQTVYYRLHRPDVVEILATLNRLYCAPATLSRKSNPPGKP